MKTIKNGIFNENPIFILMLGLCPTLAVTHNFESSYIMGLCVLVILLFTNITISLIKKLIPKNVQVPTYVLIIATFVTCLEMILSKYVPLLYDVLGIFLPLITVNCIVLGRAISVASKENLKTSFLDGLGIGLGWTFSLMLIGFFREILGNNSLTLMNAISPLTKYRAIYQIFPSSNYFPIDFFIKPAGAFFTLGLVLALINYLKNKEEK